MLWVKLLAIGEIDNNGNHEVFFELNGLPRSIKVPNKKVPKKHTVREKADSSVAGQVGAPMPGGKFLFYYII